MRQPVERSFERELETYLHQHIPISAAMGVTVSEATHDVVRLKAPLDVNINHRSTVFGGSAAAVAILAGWALLHVRLGHGGRGDRIVIQRNSIDYTLPIGDDFEAEAVAPDPLVWNRLGTMLNRRGRGRIDLATTLYCGGVAVGECVGTYVILPEETS